MLVIQNTTFRFSIPETITSSAVKAIGSNSFAQFNDDITIYEGTFLTRVFVVDTSQDQRFIIESPNIDASTLVVHVKGTGDVTIGKNIQ